MDWDLSKYPDWLATVCVGAEVTAAALLWLLLLGSSEITLELDWTADRPDGGKVSGTKTITFPGWG